MLNRRNSHWKSVIIENIVKNDLEFSMYAGAKKMLAQAITGQNVRKDFKEKAQLIKKK